jgi:hypothetical protein
MSLIDHPDDVNTISPAHLWIIHNCSTKECVWELDGYDLNMQLI